MQSRFSTLLTHAADVRTRVRFAAVLLLVLSSLLASVLDLSKVIRYAPRQLEDRVRQHEDRMKRVRELLPSHGVIGYVSDVDGMEFRSRYYMTQYVLAPLLVVPDTQRKLVLGDFTRTSRREHELAHLRVVNDLGDGVVLLTPAKQ